MRVLVVSGKKYLPTNRAVDILTGIYLNHDHEVDHLVFFTRRDLGPVYSAPRFRQLVCRDKGALYRDKMKYFLPKVAIQYLMGDLVRRNLPVDLDQYDLVLLETGYPLFLLMHLPERTRLVVRQSDPVEFAMGTRRKLFVDLEQKAIDRAEVFLYRYFESQWQVTAQTKVLQWESGFRPLGARRGIEKLNSVVYIGATPISRSLLWFLAGQFPQVQFHIVGDFQAEVTMDNVVYHGYLTEEKYAPLLESSRCFLVPYSSSAIRRMTRFEMTSKFFLPLYLGNRVLVSAHGSLMQDDPKRGIYVFSSRREAQKKLARVLAENEPFDVAGLLDHEHCDLKNAVLEKFLEDCSCV